MFKMDRLPGPRREREVIEHSGHLYCFLYQILDQRRLTLCQWLGTLIRLSNSLQNTSQKSYVMYLISIDGREVDRARIPWHHWCRLLLNLVENEQCFTCLLLYSKMTMTLTDVVTVNAMKWHWTQSSEAVVYSDFKTAKAVLGAMLCIVPNNTSYLFLNVCKPQILVAYCFI